MSKKFLYLFIFIVTSVITVGCNNDKSKYYVYDYNKDKGSDQFDFPGNYVIPELDVDGLKNEEEWNSGSTELSYGNEGNVKISMYQGNSALFVFFEIKDSNILTQGFNNGDDVTKSDSVEFYIDTNNDGSISPKDDDYQINIGAHGKARVLSGSGGSWGPWNGMIDYAVIVNGSINDTSDEDTGYTVELMLPYSQIGLNKDSSFGFSLGQVDKVTTGTVTGEDFKWYGYVHGGQFVDPQNPSKYVVLHKNEYYLRGNMPTAPIDLSGIVTDSNGVALEGVRVYIEGTDFDTLTNSFGGYLFKDVSTNKDIHIKAEKDGFLNYSKNISKLDLRSAHDILNNPITLLNSSTILYTNITLNLENVYYGLVEGAKVQVANTDILAYSNDLGEVLIENVPITSNLKLIVTKEGYEDTEILVEADSIVVDGETNLGVNEFNLLSSEKFSFGGQRGINGFDTEIIRGLNGVHFRFNTITPFEVSESIELFIDTKESTSDRNTTDYRINFNADNTVSIANFGSGTNTDVITSGITNKVIPNGEGAIIKAYIPYEFLNISKNEVFGISLGCWSGVLSDWDGWAYNGSFVAPEIPQNYIRVGINNQLYVASNNNQTVIISGNVGQEDVAVSLGDKLVFSDETGNFTIRSESMDEYLIELSKTGYITKTIILTTDDFARGVATINDYLSQKTVDITGTINEDGVVISLIEYPNIKVTSANGIYTLENVPTVEKVTIKAEKEGFTEFLKEITVQELNENTVVTKNITMISSIIKVNISGVVESYKGFEDGVTVTIKGTEESTTTNLNGEYSFSNISVGNLTLVFKKDGFIEKEVIVSAEELEVDLHVEMLKPYVETGIFSGKPSNNNSLDQISGCLSRGIEGVYFTFETTGLFQFDGTLKERIELFIDTKESTSTRNATDYLINLNSDGVVTIVNWEFGGNEDASTLEFTKTDTTMELFIPYAFLGITKDEVFGISLGEWSDFASDWDGWAYNGSFVAPENPKNYVRVGADNQLYVSNTNGFDNQETAGHTGTFSGKATPSNAMDPINGSIVREETGVRFTFETTGLFQFDGTLKERIELFIDTKESTSTRNTTDYLINLNSDGVVTIVNWEFGGNEDASTLEFTKTDTTMELFVPYAFLGITKDEVFGISLGEWSDFAGDWDGWAYNGSFVAPENPQNYVRIGTDNQLYVSNTNGFDNQETAGHTGTFSGKATPSNAMDPINGSIVREETGVRFTFETTGLFQFDGTLKERIELFIDTKESTSTRNTTDYLINLNTDGTVTIVNWELGGNEDASTLEFTKTDTTMELFIPYAFLGITKDEVFGISLGEWSDFASDWDGWAYNGSFVAPENPQNYVRIRTDNQLYVSESN